MGLLEYHDDLDCANEKDHLFAITGLVVDLGLCKDCFYMPTDEGKPHDGTCRLQIEINYGKSTRAIYMDAVARLVITESTNASRILAVVACRSTRAKTPSPSWALDWRLPRVRTSLWIDRQEYFPGTIGDLQTIKASPEDAGLLILSGSSSWGKVATVLEPSPGLPTDEQVVDWLRKTWKDLFRWVHTHNPKIKLSPAKQQFLLEQLLDVVSVLPHDLTNWDYLLLSKKVNASVRSYVTLNLYLQLHDEGKKELPGDGRDVRLGRR